MFNLHKTTHVVRFLVSIFAIINCSTCKGQMTDSFHLYGMINRDSGLVTLHPGGYDGDYPELLNFKPVRVSGGKFIVSERLPYPIYVFLKFSSGDQVYVTDGFYLTPGDQQVECHADSSREIVAIKNSAMLEFNTSFSTAEYFLIDTVHDYYQMMALKKRYVYRYAQKHPDSYVALWQISRYISDGYNNYLDSAFHILSEQIKNSETGKLIREDLVQLVLTDTGRIFPDQTLTDIHGTPKNISFKKNGSKYTLIDFWFAHCSACISQFPKYMELLKTYHEKGFSIVGISIDSSPANIKDWKDIIETKPLSWSQYRANDETIKNLRIKFYPSNFLIDSSGKILALNLGADEVTDFIRQKLN
ncbi:MAG TPA: TlpA disulfide reductase family protein [Puia sp.]|nr:TlpA disulfide reductase family protein [Puia sp.]